MTFPSYARMLHSLHFSLISLRNTHHLLKWGSIAGFVARMHLSWSVNACGLVEKVPAFFRLLITFKIQTVSSIFNYSYFSLQKSKEQSIMYGFLAWARLLQTMVHYGVRWSWSEGLSSKISQTDNQNATNRVLRKNCNVSDYFQQYENKSDPLNLIPEPSGCPTH